MLRFPSSFSLSLLGFLLSIYACHVEYKTSHQSEGDELEFDAMCDIAAIGASCRQV
jgi:hypothetical protein